MDTVQLRQITAPLIVGYLYATIVGGVLIWLVMREMRKLVGSEAAKKYQWQPHVTGVVERTLYIISFLIRRPEFVVAWLAFKAAGGWEVWKTGLTRDDKRDDPHEGRAMYSNMFNGSALSIFYAGVGYLFIIWWKDLTIPIWLAVILVVLTLVLWLVLLIIRKCYGKSSGETVLRVKDFTDELHGQAITQAADERTSLNELIIKALEEYLKKKGGK
jgi:ABC-type multidrug transport system fused ATPase/permease subunit